MPIPFITQAQKLFAPDARITASKVRYIGIANLSVANIYRSPSHSARLSTQALLGTPMTVLKRNGIWSYVQLPDSYRGWTDETLALMDSRQFAVWKKAKKIIITAYDTCAFASLNKSPGVVSDLVAGDILVLNNEKSKHYAVEYPDGRKGFVLKKHATKLGPWVARANDTPENILATALAFHGIPYLWGGASPKAMDCSGFVKLVFFLNGVLLPRDAIQQAGIGKRVTGGSDTGEVEAGDLLFFDSRAGRHRPCQVTHVGISLGGKRFIHSSGLVHIASIERSDEQYSRRWASAFIGARRIIGVGKSHGIRRLREIPYYSNG